ncbi:MAG: YebC/PmpR family DNA-binding transcriptional regulator [Clostridia bacterium]|nr:YebC/PmpR family DNA-binding transcriptional regulator [Clostridia bacterium]
MSGHSKWANIKNKKEKADSQRGKIFTKIGREIAVAVKSGGPNPDANAKLRDIIAKAKAANIPNDNIERSIKKAAGDGDTANYESLMYEGYGAAGVAIIVEALTDNRNRTAGDMRHLFDKHGGNLGQTGSVGFMFDRKGVIVIEKNDKISEDDLMMLALDAGADDFSAEDECYEILTAPENFSAVREKLESEKLELAEAEIKYVPQNYVHVEEEVAAKLTRLIDALEDNDDVQNVWTNWDEE